MSRERRERAHGLAGAPVALSQGTHSSLTRERLTR